MKYLTWCIVLPCLAVLSAEAETTAPTADDWYKNQYAPLWQENSWDKLEEIAGFYDKTISYHPLDGNITTIRSRPWLAENLQEWKSDGWLGSDIAAFQSDQLNLSTTTFKTMWRDWYADGHEEFSCGWYMADFKGDGWKFSQYIEIDCAEHDL